LHQPKHSNGKLNAHELKENVIRVDELVLSQQVQPQIHHSVHRTAQAESFKSFSTRQASLSFKETLAKEMTEAHCYSRHSCSKLLLVDVIFIWLSDEILFTLTAQTKIGEWHLVQRIERWSRNVVFTQE